jgi:hypothetical protein
MNLISHLQYFTNMIICELYWAHYKQSGYPIGFRYLLLMVKMK